jgi:hypothetical protein
MFLLVRFQKSKPFRGVSHPQMNHLLPDIFLIEYSDPGAEYHAWRHLTPNKAEIEAKAEMLLQLH